MKEELRLINALIYMSRPSLVWPTTLADFEFQLTAVQRDVVLELEGAPRTVTPEAVFVSAAEDCAILVESKSNNMNEDQARRYLAVEGDDLRTSGALAAEAAPPALVAAVYFCKSDCTNELGPRVDDFNDNERETLPLVDYDHHRFQLTRCADGSTRGVIAHNGLHAAFEAGVYFPNENYWPIRFIPFDAESDIMEMVGPVLQELTALLLDPTIEDFTARDVMGGPPDSDLQGVLAIWDQLGPMSQRHLEDRATEIIDEFRVHYVGQYVARIGNEARWRKRVEATDHAMQYRAIQRDGQDYVLRKEAGLPLPAAVADDQPEMPLEG